MISTRNEAHPYPLGRIILLAVEEILGVQEAAGLLKHARLLHSFQGPKDVKDRAIFPFRDILRLQDALSEAYGPRAGAGLSMRTGQACLKYILREYGTQLGISRMDFRLLPFPRRLTSGCEALAGLFNATTDLRIDQKSDSKQICWQFKTGAPDPEKHGQESCCPLISGFLQEAFSWMSGGRSFQVVEKKEAAAGVITCTIAVDRTPLG
jgi:hypothetical protein